jgi:hypothetical protein
METLAGILVAIGISLAGKIPGKSLFPVATHIRNSSIRPISHALYHLRLILGTLRE